MTAYVSKLFPPSKKRMRFPGFYSPVWLFLRLPMPIIERGKKFKVFLFSPKTRSKEIRSYVLEDF